jgi:outer membrane protein OmpA-like peptidoglycan-associated protein
MEVVMRLRIPALVATLAGLTSSPTTAQSPGTLEFGGFGRFTRFDASLGLRDGFGVGGLLGVYVARGLAIEGTVAYVSTTAPTSATVALTPVHVRLLLARPVADRIAVLVGGGYVHNQYTKPSRVWEDGASGLLGARFDLTGRLAARLEGVVDYFPSPLNERPGNSDNWTLTVQAGLTVHVGRSPLRDSDHDGVVDRVDVCPNTPRGEVIDGRGCPLPKDADADGVVDAVDKCPATPAGDAVDLNGCSLPKDADRDGVVDGTDRCPGTPSGDKVDMGGCSLPKDTDGDGVTDASDRCPNTPAGETVDATGCPPPKDADMDGVLNTADRCPGTPVGQRVDALGCPVLFTGVRRTIVLEGVNFETGSANLTDQSHATLDRVAASLAAYPMLRVEVAGYTDSRGSAAINLRLSQARAAAVRTYLIDKGVPPQQLTSRGFGASNPIASNATTAGRARNRRVELHRMN